jgi:hypothetical protein
MLMQKIIETFPNLNQVQVETYIMKMFNNIDDRKAFKGVIKDLMVDMKQFANQ